MPSVAQKLWTPRNVVGDANVDRYLTLASWHKSDAGITITGAGVSTWANQSTAGTTYDGTQVTDANRPAYNLSSNLLNGYPSLTFNGTSSFMSMLLGGLDIANAVPGFTCICVAKVGNASGAARFFSASTLASGVGSRVSFGFSATNAQGSTIRRADSDSASTAQASNNSYPFLRAAVYTYILDCPSPRITGFLNDQQMYTGTSGMTAGATTDATSSLAVAIGAAGNGSAAFVGAFMYELITLKYALSDYDRKRTVRALMSKYRIEV